MSLSPGEANILINVLYELNTGTLYSLVLQPIEPDGILKHFCKELIPHVDLFRRIVSRRVASDASCVDRPLSRCLWAVAN